MDIEQALKLVKRRPGMYIGTPNIKALRHFIEGFLFNNIKCNRGYPLDECFIYKIHDWMKQKIEEKCDRKFDLSMGYDYYIEAVCDSGEQEVDLFFELCEEFIEEMKNKNS